MVAARLPEPADKLTLATTMLAELTIARSPRARVPLKCATELACLVAFDTKAPKAPLGLSASVTVIDSVWGQGRPPRPTVPHPLDAIPKDHDATMIGAAESTLVNVVGGLETTRVKFCTASGGTPLEAVIVMGNVPV